MSITKKSILLLCLVVFIGAIPLFLINDSEFPGAEGSAQEAIMEINPDYKPWFTAILEPPGGETESLLFAIQAALGAGFIGYYFGLKRGQKVVNRR